MLNRRLTWLGSVVVVVVVDPSAGVEDRQVGAGGSGPCALGIGSNAVY